MRKHLTKETLVHGKYYTGHCRNATEARWDAYKQKFFHWRQKFTERWVESIHCPENSIGFDVFYAVSVESNPREEIPLE